MENLKAGSTARSTPPDQPSTRPSKHSSSPLPEPLVSGRGSVHRRPGASSRLICFAALASAAAAGTWVFAAALTASHGLDSTDEGFYLLSYRWWDTDLRTFTGAQFVYGPVFELLGHNIAGLRLVRLLTIIVSNAALGWTFMRWLRLQRPNAAATRWWEAAGTAAIVACGGMTYSWLPLSPGYNDVSLLGALLAAAVVLKIAAEVDRGRTVRLWVPLSIGPVAFAMLISKWSSSGLTLLVVALVGVVVMAPAGVRQIARVAAWALVGFLLSTAAVQLFIVRLDQALPLMVATNKLVAAGINNPTSLLLLYERTFAHLIIRMALAHALLLVSAVAAVTLRSKLGSGVAAVLTVAAAIVSFRSLLAVGAFTGGNLNIRTYCVGLSLVLALALIMAIGTLLDRRRPFPTGSSLGLEGWRGAAVVILLLALPLTQAAGTGNPIFYLAFNCFSTWAALMILVLTGMESAPPVARALTAAAVAAAVALSATIGTTALWHHPYRTSDPSLSTTSVLGVQTLRSVTLAPNQAEIYSRLHGELEPYLTPGGGTYMMGFDGLAGIIFALDGRSVGEAWYSGTGRARTAAGIRAACPGGKGPWGARPPILLFNRAISPTEIGALKACGLTIARDYRRLDNYSDHHQLENPADTARITVYVGTAEFAAHGKGKP